MAIAPILSVAIYLIIWWTILFAILPLGVRTQGEEGSVVPGTPESAPASPRLLYKMGLTTLVSAVIFIIIYLIVAFQLISPGWFLPKGF